MGQNCESEINLSEYISLITKTGWNEGSTVVTEDD